MKSLYKLLFCVGLLLLYTGCSSSPVAKHAIVSKVSYDIADMPICEIGEMSLLFDKNGVRIWNSQKYLSKFSVNVNLQNTAVLYDVIFNVSLFDGERELVREDVSVLLLNPDDSYKIFIDIPNGIDATSFKLNSISAKVTDSKAENEYYEFGAGGIEQISNSTYVSTDKQPRYVALLNKDGFVVDTFYVFGKQNIISSGADISSHEILLKGGEIVEP